MSHCVVQSTGRPAEQVNYPSLSPAGTLPRPSRFLGFAAPIQFSSMSPFCCSTMEQPTSAPLSSAGPGLRAIPQGSSPRSPTSILMASWIFCSALERFLPSCLATAMAGLCLLACRLLRSPRLKASRSILMATRRLIWYPSPAAISQAMVMADLAMPSQSPSPRDLP